MEIVKQYIGSMNIADSATNKLDIDTVLHACDEIDSIANEFIDIGKHYQAYGDSFLPDKMYVDGKSFNEDVITVSDTILSVGSYILSTTEQIRYSTINNYNKIQIQYNNEAIAREGSGQ